ncbi:MAG: 50S ribosomal protein L23 [Planctomycetes bacterium]|nr:50S ribosomal protein L23 [Planctomycetota bacterium]
MHRAEVRNEYTFEVALGANKIQIRTALEDIYDVKIVRVNTSTKTGLTRRFGWNWSKDSSTKKAMVKLAEGYKFDLL